MASTIYLLPAIIIFCYIPSVSAFVTTQFQMWYPEWDFIFKRILRENCTEEYKYYLGGQRNETRLSLFDRWVGASWTSAVVQPVASCILSNTSDWIKSEMASAAVVLGLTPPILAALGPSIEETATLFLIAPRSFLVTCLAAGSPAVNPFRALEYTNPLDILNQREHRLKFPTFPGWAHSIILLVEYLIIAAAIANMATVTRDLGLKASYTFAPQLVYLPLLWAYLGSLAHGFGVMALRLRLKRSKSPDDPRRLNWFHAQIKPLALQDAEHFQRFTVVGESFPYILFSWLTSVGIACHIIFGTLTFSSVLFISVRDSVFVMLRFMASVLLCRSVLMYELAILRNQWNDKSEEEDNELLIQKTSHNVV